MTKWSKQHKRLRASFKVKVSYRNGKTRGTIALPAPLLDLFHHCEYVEFVPTYGPDGGFFVVRPVDSV